MLLFIFILCLLVSTAGIGISSAAIVLSALIQSFKNKNFKDLILPKWISVTLLGYILITFISYIVNGVADTPLRESFVDLRWIVIMSALVYIFDRTTLSENKFIKTYFVILGIIGLYGIVQFFTGIEIKKGVHPYPYNGFFRVVGFWGSPMTYAHSFGMLSCLLFAYFVSNLKDSQKRLQIICSLLFIISVFMTLTRGVWIGMTAGFLVILFYYRKKYVILFLLLLFTIILSAKYSSSNVYNRLASITNERKNHGRIWIWKNHFNIFMNYPILGIGAGENGRRANEFVLEGTPPTIPIQTHAHNQFLDVLATRGVVGFSFYFFFVSYLFFINLKMLSRIPATDRFYKNLALGCLGAQTCLILSGLTEANFEDNEVTYMAVLIFALVIHLHKKYLGKKTSLQELEILGG